MAAIDCCTREITGWQLETRCRAREAIALIERAGIAHRGGYRDLESQAFIESCSASSRSAAYSATSSRPLTKPGR